MLKLCEGVLLLFGGVARSSIKLDSSPRTPLVLKLFRLRLVLLPKFAS